MNIRIPLLVSCAMIVAMLTVSAWAWSIMPTHAIIAIHWGFDGRPDASMAATWGLLLLPAMACALTTLLAALPRIEPRRENLAASWKLYFAGWIGGIAVLLVTHVLVALNALGYAVDVPRWAILSVAALMAVLGNFLGKSRSTFFVGFRLPWTLSSEAAWEKSNRLAGRGFFLTGLVTMAVVVFAGTVAGGGTLGAGVTASVLIGGVASYIQWKHDAGRGLGDSSGT